MHKTNENIIWLSNHFKPNIGSEHTDQQTSTAYNSIDASILDYIARAEQGDLDAIIEVADAYYTGDGLPVNCEKAIEYIERAIKVARQENNLDSLNGCLVQMAWAKLKLADTHGLELALIEYIKFAATIPPDNWNWDLLSDLCRHFKVRD